MSTPAAQRPLLSFWQIWNMSFGFLGIQFGFALQNANTSLIFAQLGAKVDELAILWLAAPITGLLIQPIIGFYSDRTWHPVWGRRRPYFAIGAILASSALCIMPNSSALWMAVGTLWLMDASINISMEPFRALIGDMLAPEQRTAGFARQSMFIGIGSVIASALPYALTNWFNVDNENGIITDTVRYSFYLGGFMLLATVLWTVFTTKEYPPETEAEKNIGAELKPIDKPSEAKARFLRTGSILVVLGIAIATVIFTTGSEKELYVLGGGLILFGLIFLFSAALVGGGKTHAGIVHMANDFLGMPKTMVQLAYVQFFSWVALFSMWIYTTPVVASQVFGATDPNSADYKSAGVWVGILFGAYNLVAAIAALLLPSLAKYTSRRVTHLIALTCGGLGLISFYFIHDQQWLLVSMIGVGIAWCSILSIPYAMLSGSLPREKMGYYMGIFNFFIVIPQIIAATVLGFFLRHVFHNDPVYIFLMGGCSMIIAGLLCLTVRDSDEVVMSER